MIEIQRQHVVVFFLCEQIFCCTTPLLFFTKFKIYNSYTIDTHVLERLNEGTMTRSIEDRVPDADFSVLTADQHAALTEEAARHEEVWSGHGKPDFTDFAVAMVIRGGVNRAREERAEAALITEHIE